MKKFVCEGGEVGKVIGGVVYELKTSLLCFFVIFVFKLFVYSLLIYGNRAVQNTEQTENI